MNGAGRGMKLAHKRRIDENVCHEGVIFFSREVRVWGFPACCFDLRSQAQCDNRSPAFLSDSTEGPF